MIPYIVATKKITKTQSESVDSTGAKKKRKIVKRLVDNMYIDEDGSMGILLSHYYNWL